MLGIEVSVIPTSPSSPISHSGVPCCSSSAKITQTLHGTAIYADQLTPLAPPQLIGKYNSPMECLGHVNPLRENTQKHPSNRPGHLRRTTSRANHSLHRAHVANVASAAPWWEQSKVSRVAFGQRGDQSVDRSERGLEDRCCSFGSYRL